MGFTDRIGRITRPDALRRDEPWPWSPGKGNDVWEMFCASIAGDLERVKAWVEYDPALVRCHYEYRTPLWFAVRNNHLDVAEYLLEHDALKVGLGNPLEMATERGHAEMAALIERTMAERHGASAAGEPLAAAIRARDAGIVRALLRENPALLHTGDRGSSQPIHWAVMTRQLDLIDELLALGADINAPRFDGARPIHLSNGDYTYRGWRDLPSEVTTTPRQVYDHLVAKGAEVDLGMAAYTGDIARVRELLARDPDSVNRVAEYNSYYVGCGAPIKNAVVGGQRAIVELLLEHGADPNLPEEQIAPRGHAFYSAVYHRHHDIAELLLAHGANPDQPVESSAEPVWIAIANRDERMLALLGAHGARWEIPNRLEGGLTYEGIVATGIVPGVAVLAAYGDIARAESRFAADPSAADDLEAFTIAANKGDEAFMRLMLGHQPSLISRVSVSKPRAIAEWLFEQGMDPNHATWMGHTALHRLAESGDVDGAALYLDHGADLTRRDGDHESTPLAHAAMHGRREMVEFLLSRGAPVELPDDPPWATALTWAKRKGYTEIVSLLERAG